MTDIVGMAQMAGVFVATCAAIAVIVTLLGIATRLVQRALPSVREKGLQQRPDDDRMLRLEQAVDSIAVEVERISESQRFISKLMDERSKEPARLP